jgi:hypothetical protein
MRLGAGDRWHQVLDLPLPEAAAVARSADWRPADPAAGRLFDRLAGLSPDAVARAAATVTDNVVTVEVRGVVLSVAVSPDGTRLTIVRLPPRRRRPVLEIFALPGGRLVRQPGRRPSWPVRVLDLGSGLLVAERARTDRLTWYDSGRRRVLWPSDRRTPQRLWDATRTADGFAALYGTSAPDRAQGLMLGHAAGQPPVVVPLGELGVAVGGAYDGPAYRTGLAADQDSGRLVIAAETPLGHDVVLLDGAARVIARGECTDGSGLPYAHRLWPGMLFSDPDQIIVGSHHSGASATAGVWRLDGDRLSRQPVTGLAGSLAVLAPLGLVVGDLRRTWPSGPLGWWDATTLTPTDPPSLAEALTDAGLWASPDGATVATIRSAADGRSTRLAVHDLRSVRAGQLMEAPLSSLTVADLAVLLELPADDRVRPVLDIMVGYLRLTHPDRAAPPPSPVTRPGSVTRPGPVTRWWSPLAEVPLAEAVTRVASLPAGPGDQAGRQLLDQLAALVPDEVTAVARALRRPWTIGLDVAEMVLAVAFSPDLSEVAVVTYQGLRGPHRMDVFALPSGQRLARYRVADLPGDIVHCGDAIVHLTRERRGATHLVRHSRGGSRVVWTRRRSSPKSLVPLGSLVPHGSGYVAAAVRVTGTNRVELLIAGSSDGPVEQIPVAELLDVGPRLGWVELASHHPTGRLAICGTHPPLLALLDQNLRVLARSDGPAPPRSADEPSPGAATDDDLGSPFDGAIKVHFAGSDRLVTGDRDTLWSWRRVGETLVPERHRAVGGVSRVVPLLASDELAIVGSIWTDRYLGAATLAPNPVPHYLRRHPTNDLWSSLGGELLLVSLVGVDLVRDQRPEQLRVADLLARPLGALTPADVPLLAAADRAFAPGHPARPALAVLRAWLAYRFEA